MKKTAMKLISLVLCFAFAVSLIPASDVYAVDEGIAWLYTETFDAESFDALKSNGYWKVENTNHYTQGTAPAVSDGKLKASSTQSMSFWWQGVPGVGTYNSANTYYYDFDVKITDAGAIKSEGANTKVRALFVAPGGWFNQIELPTKDGKVRAGDTYDSYVDDATFNAKYLNKDLHVSIVWFGNKITTTIKDSLGNVVLSGARTGSDYTNINYENSGVKVMQNMVFRCEDGAFEIDNFKFGINASSAEHVHAYTSYAINDDGTHSPMCSCGLVKNEKAAHSFTNGVCVCGACIDTHSTAVTANPIAITGASLAGSESGNSFVNVTFSRDFDKYTPNYRYWLAAIITDDLTIDTRKKAVSTTETIWLDDNKDLVGFSGIRFKFNESDLNNLFAMVEPGGEYEGCLVAIRFEETDGSVLGNGVLDMFCDRINGGYPSANLKANTPARSEQHDVEVLPISAPVSSTDMNVPSGYQAIYSADVTYDGTKPVYLYYNSTCIFYIGPNGLKFFGNKTTGTYGSGTYGIKVYANPEQDMTYVEVTLPDGGVVKRGASGVVPFSTGKFAVYSAKNDCVANAKISYSEITGNDYILKTVEPTGYGFGTKVYNVISSFEDASTTRLFAWTALHSYIGNDGEMSLYYREAGESTWNEVAATRRTEKTTVSSEDYFIANLAELEPDTTYEYYIAKKGCESNSDDGSAVYTFKTAAQTVDSFSFIAVGDTQGVSWAGRTLSTADGKGFMFAEAALSEAFKNNPDAAFILHTGDVVENGRSTEQYKMYFKALGDKAYSVPHFAANGNHDMYSIDDACEDFLFNYMFNHPKSGEETFSADVQAPANLRDATIFKSHEESTYSFNYGNVHFVVFNGGCYDNYNTAGGDARKGDEAVQLAQAAWLEADLEANKDARWTILLTHQPVYHRIGGAEDSPWLAEIIEKYVDLAILGHSHIVTRSYPMKNGEIVTKESLDLIKKGTGTVYTTIGATTLNHDTMGNPNVEEMAVIAQPAQEQPAYTNVTVDNGKITVTIKQVNGLVLDEFTIEAGLDIEAEMSAVDEGEDGKIDTFYLNAAVPDDGAEYGFIIGENDYATDEYLKFVKDGGNPLFTKQCKKYDVTLQTPVYGDSEITAVNCGGTLDDKLIAFRWDNMLTYATLGYRVYKVLEDGSYEYGPVKTVTFSDNLNLAPLAE